jgi:glycosyltransferase involved in cell wall biosynthesis
MIWHLIDSSTIGGAERHVAMVVQALRRRGIDATAVLYRDYGANPWLRQLAAADVPVRVLGGSFLDLIMAMRRSRPVVLHTHGYKAGILGRPAAIMCGVPLVATFHTGERSSGRLGLYERLDEWTSVISKRISVSPAVQQRLPLSSTVIGSFVRPPTNAVAGVLPRRIGFVGRLSQEKRPDLFCALAERSPPGLEWHIYGDGPMRAELEARHSRTVRFHGITEDMDSVWPTLGLLVMPSLFEGLPLAALEALASGVPLLASRVGGLPDLVVEDKTGWLFAYGDLDEASVLLEKWIGLDLSGQQQMGLACRAHAAVHFSESEQMAKLLSIYESAGYSAKHEL